MVVDKKDVLICVNDNDNGPNGIYSTPVVTSCEKRFAA